MTDSPARIEMALPDGSPEKSFAPVARCGPVVFPGRPVAADRARLVLAGHGRRVHLRRVDGLQISWFSVYRQAIEIRFCCKSISVNSYFTRTHDNIAAPSPYRNNTRISYRTSVRCLT